MRTTVVELLTATIPSRVTRLLPRGAKLLTVALALEIDGELRYRVADDAVAEISPRAAISGSVEVLDPRERDDGSLGFSVARFLAFLLAGAVLIALLPGPLALILAVLYGVAPMPQR